MPILILTDFALLRIVKAFGLRQGLDSVFSDTLAQVHLGTSSIHTNWNTFLTKNCLNCRKDPDTCDYLNPTEESVSRFSGNPDNVKVAVALNIESGALACPAKEEK